MYLSCEQKRTDRKRVIYCDYTYIMLTNTPQQRPSRAHAAAKQKIFSCALLRLYHAFTPSTPPAHARLPTNGWQIVLNNHRMMGHPYKTPGYDQERNSQQGCLVDNDHRLLLTIAVINATNAEELLAVTTTNADELLAVTTTAGLLAATATTV